MKILFLLFLLNGLSSDAPKQGICGKITWIEGNQMPGPGPRPKPQGIIREILIYEVATREQATQQRGFYETVNTKLVGKTVSKADGAYKISLPPGRYSVFIKEEKGLFANIFDQDGAINPVTVETGKFSTLNISINYKAAY